MERNQVGGSKRGEIYEMWHLFYCCDWETSLEHCQCRHNQSALSGTNQTIQLTWLIQFLKNFFICRHRQTKVKHVRKANKNPLFFFAFSFIHDFFLVLFASIMILLLYLCVLLFVVKLNCTSFSDALAELCSQPSLCITYSTISWRDNGAHSPPPLLCFCVLSSLPSLWAQHQEAKLAKMLSIFVVQFHWRAELFFSLNWGWIRCWLPSLAAVSHCEGPSVRMHALGSWGMMECG